LSACSKGSSDVGGDYLVLQDITEDFDEPNIMDVKMGARTYGPDASKSKMVQVPEGRGPFLTSQN
jgi:hypothetical protein